MAALSTKFVENFEKAQTATKVMGTPQIEKDMAQRLTAMELFSWNASWTGTATGAIDMTVIVWQTVAMNTTARISQRQGVVL